MAVRVPGKEYILKDPTTGFAIDTRYGANHQMLLTTIAKFSAIQDFSRLSSDQRMLLEATIQATQHTQVNEPLGKAINEIKRKLGQATISGSSSSPVSSNPQGSNLTQEKVSIVQNRVQNPATTQELHQACIEKDMFKFRDALRRGANTNRETLTYAVSSMNMSIVIDAVNAGATADEKTLTMACSTRDINMVLYAINQLKAWPIPQETLKFARESGNQQIIDAVIRAGAT